MLEGLRRRSCREFGGAEEPVGDRGQEPTAVWLRRGLT